MNAKQRWMRFLIGLAVSLVVLIIGFTIIRVNIPTWGATQAEVIETLPGDELLSRPLSAWVNAVTVDAAPEEVWGWIIQMGDTRGGFYSYMFIERLMMRAFGYSAAQAQQTYHNANVIYPEWQNPPAGQGMIADYVAIKSYQPGEYLLASATDKFAGMGWTWMWYIRPTEDGKTRLIVHLRIQPPGAEVPNPVMDAVGGTAMDLASFVMEKGMLDGLKLRAEGGSEPEWIETVEIGLWLVAFALGIAAAVQYMRRTRWQMPLALGLAAIILLLVFTYLQPVVWLRAVLDLALLGGVLFIKE